MAKSRIFIVKDTDVRTIKKGDVDYISITDIARFKNSNEPKDVVKNWLRSRNTIEYLGLWERLNNIDFNVSEFESILQEAGANAFTMSPTRWVESTNAIGIITKTGANGGTYAHYDIAIKFASWVAVEFELYLIKEFQRFKQQELALKGWTVKRELTKINYSIHTHAIKSNLIPPTITKKQASIIYANEADVLNVALFGITAKEWREQNPGKEGNIRDYASINELICLSSMETMNAIYIKDGLPQEERLIKLNELAIYVMNVLQNEIGTHNLLNEPQ